MAETQTQGVEIIGAGAMGHLWSAHLQKAAIQYRLYARKPAQPQHFKLISAEQEFDFQLAYHQLEEISTADTLMICVKAPALETLCQQLLHSFKNTVSPKIILLMMNGMGLAQQVKRHFPSSLVIQASTTHGAYLSHPKINQRQTPQIHHTGKGETLIGDPLIEQNRQQISQFKPALQAFIAELNSALPKTFWVEDYQAILWRKLLINSVINPLTSLYEVKNGAIYQEKDLLQKAEALSQELMPIIQRQLPQESWQSLFDRIISVAKSTQTNISSMRQDRAAGRVTEIEAINGYLLKYAAKQGIQLPLHQQIYQKIKGFQPNPLK